MAWRKWTSKDGEIPEGSSVKIGKNFGYLSDKVGKVITTSPSANFSIVKVSGQKRSFHNSDLFIKTEVFGESMKSNKSVIKEEIGTTISYAAIAIILAGESYFLIKNAIKNLGINSLGDVVNTVLDKVFPKWSKDKKINNIAKKLSKIPSVMQFVKNPNKPGIQKEIAKHLSKDELNYIRYLKRDVIKKQNESIIKESSPLIAYNVRIGNKKDGVSLKSVKVTGNSPEEFVQNLKSELKKANLPKLSPTAEKNIISNLQKQLDQFKNLNFEEQNIREAVKKEIKKLVKEGYGEYNNLPDSNSYHKVIKPFDIWVLSGSEHRGEHYGNSKIYRGVYKKTKAKVGDEIHNLPGGLFYVPKSGNPVEMKTDEPSDKGAFEHGRDFNTFDLNKLIDIPMGQQKKVRYR